MRSQPQPLWQLTEPTPRQLELKFISHFSATFLFDSNLGSVGGPVLSETLAIRLHVSVCYD